MLRESKMYKYILILLSFTSDQNNFFPQLFGTYVLMYVLA